MTVYVVAHGESGKGQTPIVVFSSLAKAKAFALGIHVDGGWEVYIDGKDQIWAQNGCDVIRVIRFDVQ
jgi:hypothetical protein